jgi:hypothetical protein
MNEHGLPLSSTAMRAARQVVAKRVGVVAENGEAVDLCVDWYESMPYS